VDDGALLLEHQHLLLLRNILEDSQSSDLYSNVVHLFNSSVNKTSAKKLNIVCKYIQRSTTNLLYLKAEVVNRTAHIRHQCRITIVLNCHRQTDRHIDGLTSGWIDR
jgi:hypothetical protein